MLDREQLKYTVKEIKKNINKPYMMSNAPLADELLKELIVYFPAIKMVQLGTSQMFYVTDKSKSKVQEHIKNHISDLQRKLVIYETSLSNLN